MVRIKIFYLFFIFSSNFTTGRPAGGGNGTAVSQKPLTAVKHQRRRRAAVNMAASTEQNGKAACNSDVDHLLHPELLSLDFMQLILSEVSQRLKRNAGKCHLMGGLTEEYRNVSI